MPRKVIERGQQANQARDAAMAAAGMEAEETTALDFYLDRLTTDIQESPGRVLDVAANFAAGIPGALGDAQRLTQPEGVNYLPTTSDIAEDMGASGEGYAAIIGQLLSPLSPSDFKIAWGAGKALLGHSLAGSVIGFTGKRIDKAIRGYTTKIDANQLKLDEMWGELQKLRNDYDERWGETPWLYVDEDPTYLRRVGFRKGVNPEELLRDIKADTKQIDDLTNRYNSLLSENKQLEFERRGFFDELSRENAPGRALEAAKPTTSGVDNVTDLVQRRKEINQEHDRVINEIRMRVTEDLQDMKTASQLESVDPESIHKIGDRFVSEGPAIVRGNEMPGQVRLEIKKYNRVGDDGTVYYDVEQTFPDGSKGMVTLKNDNLSYTKKMGGFEVAKPTTSGPK